LDFARENKIVSKSIYVAGIDIGSLTSKAVILNAAGKVVASAIGSTKHDSSQVATQIMGEGLSKCGLDFQDLSYVVATGYGRTQVPFANRKLTEIMCHAKGIYRLFPSARSIIDVGGQDSKAIAINSNGAVLNFVLNDKCAAGTGRFFEVMASALDIRLEDMGDMAVNAAQRPSISSVCTVFAESEIIGMMVRGIPKDWIVAGLCESVANRLYGMLIRVNLTEDFVFTGGVAKNKGVVKMLGEQIGKDFLIPEEPQLTGALGAALIALDSALQRKDEPKGKPASG
jgi:predicted CoA-substrate-specific enzyme activase